MLRRQCHNTPVISYIRYDTSYNNSIMPYLRKTKTNCSVLSRLNLSLDYYGRGKVVTLNDRLQQKSIKHFL